MKKTLKFEKRLNSESKHNSPKRSHLFLEKSFNLKKKSVLETFSSISLDSLLTDHYLNCNIEEFENKEKELNSPKFKFLKNKSDKYVDFKLSVKKF